METEVTPRNLPRPDQRTGEASARFDGIDPSPAAPRVGTPATLPPLGRRWQTPHLAPKRSGGEPVFVPF